MEDNVHIEYHDTNKQSIERVNETYHYIQENKWSSYKIYDAQKKIEEIKLPIIVLLVKKYLINDLSIAIIVKFKSNLYKLEEKLGTKCLICSDLSQKEICNNIMEFRNNNKKIIIATLMSIQGLGIRLNKFNNSPIISLMTIHLNKSGYQQLYGRMCKDDGKNLPILKIICLANTAEEDFCIEMKNEIKKDYNQFYKTLKDSAIDFIG